MTRTQLLWLFIWIFIFFLITCLWNKLQHFTPTQTLTTPTSYHDSANLRDKDMYFKALKVGTCVTLSGIVASQGDKEKMLDAYGKVFDEVTADDLKVDSAIKEETPLNFFVNFADNFSHFESGYLAYDNGHLEIDGMAEHTIVQQTLQEQLSQLKNIKIDNKLHIGYSLDVEKKVEPTPIVEENSTKADIAPKATINVQEILDEMAQKQHVRFLYARDILTTSSKAFIDEIITLLKDNNETHIEIIGHTDSDGTKKRNLLLSQRRANSVKRYMIENGINESLLSARGMGESAPLVKNDTLKNRRINRRVEFKVIGE